MSRRQSFRVIENPHYIGPAWVQSRPPLSHDGNPARGIAVAVVAGCVLWGLGAAIWWAAVSGACSK